MPALQESSVKLAEKTTLSPDYVQLVGAAALGDNIRKSRKYDPVKTVVALSAELEFCAISYCGAAKTDDLVFDEVVSFVMDRFGHIGVNEIREAFRLAAAGEFEVDLSTYYGLFTVKLMGDILNGYNNYRNRVVEEFSKLQSQSDLQSKRALQKETWDTEVWAERRLSILKSLENPNYHCFTAYDYEYFTKTGQLQFTEDQKKKAWTDSHQFAYSELATAALSNFSLRRQLERVMTNQPDEGYKSKRICIAQQLLVMRWLHPETENQTEPELQAQ